MSLPSNVRHLGDLVRFSFGHELTQKLAAQIPTFDEASLNDFWGRFVEEFLPSYNFPDKPPGELRPFVGFSSPGPLDMHDVWEPEHHDRLLEIVKKHVIYGNSLALEDPLIAWSNSVFEREYDDAGHERVAQVHMPRGWPAEDRETLGQVVGFLAAVQPFLDANVLVLVESEPPEFLVNLPKGTAPPKAGALTAALFADVIDDEWRSWRRYPGIQSSAGRERAIARAQEDVLNAMALSSTVEGKTDIYMPYRHYQIALKDLVDRAEISAPKNTADLRVIGGIVSALLPVMDTRKLSLADIVALRNQQPELDQWRSGISRIVGRLAAVPMEELVETRSEVTRVCRDELQEAAREVRLGLGRDSLLRGIPKAAGTFAISAVGAAATGVSPEASVAGGAVAGVLQFVWDFLVAGRRSGPGTLVRHYSTLLPSDAPRRA